MAQHIIRAVIAGVFLVAGISKVIYPLQVVRVLVFLVPPLSQTPDFTLALPGLLAGFEVGVALALVLCRRESWPIIGAGVALLVFTGVLGVLASRPAAPRCGCFGLPSDMAVGSEAAIGLLRNFGLLCLTASLLLHQRRTSPAHGAEPAQPLRPAAPRGFSLIELLVCIAIIGVVLAIALPTLSGARAAGRISQRVQTARQLDAALAMYAHDHRDQLPFFGTPGNALAPIVIRGFEVPGPYFRMQRWLWASAIAPEYFDAARTAIESPGRLDYMRTELGWPESIIAADYQLTSTAFALPAFWRADLGSVNLNEELLAPTRLSLIAFPALKGLIATDLAGPRGGPTTTGSAPMIVALGDGSARSIDWRTLDWTRAVPRPWGAAGEPIESTIDGLAGTDF